MKIAVEHNKEGVTSIDGSFYEDKIELTDIVKKYIKLGITPIIDDFLITKNGNSYKIVSRYFGNNIVFYVED